MVQIGGGVVDGCKDDIIGLWNILMRVEDLA